MKAHKLSFLFALAITLSIPVEGINSPGIQGHEHTPALKGISPTPSGVPLDSVYEAWVARYDGPGSNVDHAFAITIDDFGSIEVAGVSTGIGPGLAYDYATVKYDTSGNEQWVARYNGPGDNLDYAVAVAADELGNVYVTGYSWATSTLFDYATIKYNSSGIEQWVARYNGPGNRYDHAVALAVDDSGNVYVTGDSEGSGTSVDFATIKYDTYGIEQWITRYNGPGSLWDYATAIAMDSLGNAYVTGNSFGDGTQADYSTVKYDAGGIEQWVARYNGLGNGSDYPSALAVDRGGNACVTGESGGSGTFSDYTTVKYDCSGNELWTARYDGPGSGFDYGRAVAVDGFGNVYVTGDSWGTSTFEDYVTIKYDSTGNEKWVARYNGPLSRGDVANQVVADDSGNIYVTGYSRGLGTLQDYVTIKYDTSGVERWVVRYDGEGSGNDEAEGIVVDNSGNIYVTGQDGNSDYATVKYEEQSLVSDAGGGQDDSPLPYEFRLFQNYPNPFNPSTTIKYALPRNAFVRLEVYSVLGERVRTLSDGWQDAGYHRVVFDAEGLPSGIYFYRLRAGDFVETKKLVLMK